MKKRLLSILLCLCMVCTLLPVTAMASYGHTAHCVCGKTESCGDGHNSEQAWTAWTSDNSLPGSNGSSGSFYLTKDVTLTADWVSTASWINVCLNGYKIDLNGHVIGVMHSRKRVSITDCNSTNTTYTFKTTGTTVNGNGGLWVLDPNATGDTARTVTGGIITGGKGYAPDAGSTRLGGAVYIHNSGAFNMYGGAFVGNQARNAGGAVHINQGTFNMYGGAILGNVSDGEDNRIYGNNGGGVFVAGSGVFSMSGGTISENVVHNNKSGGGVMNDGAFNISGSPVITGNKKGASDSNVYLPTDKRINVTGALTEESQIGVEVNAANGVGVFTSGWNTYNSTVTKENFGKYFTSDRNGLVVVKSGNELKLAEPPVLATGVTLNKTETTIGTGNTETLTATVEPNNATDKSVTWGSSNENIATVDQTGKVTAVAKGSATITATAADGSGKSATCTVTVLETITGPIVITSDELLVGHEFDITSIEASLEKCSMFSRSISPTSNIYAGGNYTVSVTLKPDSGYCFDSGRTVATFNGEPANVTVNDNGTATFSRFYTIDASVANSIEIYEGEDEATTPQFITLPGIGGADETATFTAKVKDQYGQVMNNQAVSWRIVDSSSQHSDKVTVADGVVTVKDGAAVGDYTLTAECGGRTDSITISVQKGASVATTVEVTGPQSITIPETGSTTVEGYSVKVFDQYGVEIQINSYDYGFYLGNEVTATDKITYNTETGAVTVTNEAIPGECTFKVTYTYVDANDNDVDIYGEMTITLVSLQEQTITCANVTGTYGQTEEIVLNPSGKQTAGAYTFAIKDGAATNVVTVNEEGKLTIQNAGETIIVVTAPGDGTYATAKIECTVTIAKAASVVTDDPDAIGDLTYTGSAQALVTAGTAENGTMQYKVGENGTWSASIPTGTDVGTYTVYYMSKGSPNYSDSDVSSVTVSISKAKVTAPTADSTEFTYTGTAQTYTLAAGAGYTIGGDSVTQLNAGTYIITVSLNDANNTEWSDGTTAAKNYEFVIAKADNAVTDAPDAIEGLVYNGDPNKLINAGRATGGEMQYRLDGGTYGTAIPEATNAGTYTVYYKVVGGINYEDVAEDSLTVTIAKATPEVTTWPTVSGTVYVNGTAALNSNGVVANGVVGTFELEQTSWATSGEKTVAVTFKPADRTNYNNAVNTSYTVTVVKRQVASVEEQTAITDKLYGMAQGELGLPETVRITTDDGKTFENVPVTWSGYNANTLDAQSLTGSLDLTAIAEEVEQPTTAITASITVDLQERTVENFSYEDKTVKYTGSAITHEIADGLTGVASISYSYEGTGETQYAASATAPTNAGTYKVTATFTMEDGYGAVAPKTANLIINKAEVAEPTLSGTYTYNGEVQTATLTGVEAYMTVTGNTQTNAGTYTITVTLDANHTWAAGSDGSISWTIGKAAVTVAAKNQSIYVGEDAPDLASPVKDTHYTVTGLFGEDTIDLSGIAMVYSETPDTSVAGTFEITITGADGGTNYDVEYTTGTLTVSARPIAPPPYIPPVVEREHKCESICPTCGKCMDAECTEDICADKCSGGENVFADVKEGMWYTEAVKYVYHRGMMEGVGNDLFDINGTTTRAMIVTILWRLEGEPVVNYLMQFDDIPAESWFTEAVRWAASEKIVEGWNGKFDPMGEITREQFATILWRYAKYKGYDVYAGEDANLLSYGDAFSISEYAVPAMQWACGAGLMQGDGVNLIPKAAATRAQTAALFQRFCENVEEK